MSESFNFEYCRCRTCGYEWRKGLNGSHSCAENLQKQLAEARKNELKLLQEVEPVFSNFDSSPWRLEDDEPEIAQIWYNVLDRLKQLKDWDK